ncbi:hypothetical protein Cadr_000008856 [Camelus dromedarius]|uniref:Anthrax toxin receptor-like n=1 Tax=Camelus dromedarius TaxID=9838 RepID=A0A5N4DK06_CAMDR|nr:hypothetical protein Cadr_000008856 [Camelus dromedarius]
MPSLQMTSPQTALPPPVPLPAEVPPQAPPPPPTLCIPYVIPLNFFWLIPALLLFLLLLLCIWWLCRKKTIKEPPPTQERAQDPEDTCPMQTCPTVIVPCGCQGGRMKRMQVAKMPSCVSACDNAEKPDWEMHQCRPNEPPAWAVALQPHDLRSAQPGVLPHQELLLTVPNSPVHVPQAAHQDAADDLPSCPLAPWCPEGVAMMCPPPNSWVFIFHQGLGCVRL